MAVSEPSDSVTSAAVPAPAAAAGERHAVTPEVVYRHTVAVRATHWVNALCLALLLLSGLRIFNYHPALYWGNYGYRGVPSVLAIGSIVDPATGQRAGITRIGSENFTTTGVLGISYDLDGGVEQRAFPIWLTMPGDLGRARDWHFLTAWLLVANGALYLLYGLFSGHIHRDLAPAVDQLRPRHVLADIWDHLRLRVPRGEATRRYSVLQKVTYLAVIFVLLPVMVLSGLTMSPGITTVLPGLFDLFGGRQSARTIHFLVASLLVLFVLIHVFEVFVAGIVNGMRSMITGRYVVRPVIKPQGES